MLVGASGRIFVVGDDDQSIYGWRGARIEHIQQAQNDFPGTKVIKLEQNYRSTGTILEAANALISNNPSRLGKELWTDGKKGDPITLYSAFNEIVSPFCHQSNIEVCPGRGSSSGNCDPLPFQCTVTCF